MKKWTAVMILIVVLLFGSVIAYNFYKQKKMAEFLANRPPPEFPVTAMMVKGASWTPGINSIGFVEPNHGVSLAAELSGKVAAINFESGQRIELNQVLVELDQSVEQANLDSAEGKLPFTKATFERMKKLVDKGNVSKEDFDKSQSDYQELLAQIEGLKATIERHNIIAPFSGTAGISNIHLGQYLQPGDKITRLEDTSLMRIRFTIAQSDISRISVGQKINIMVDAFPETPFSGEVTAVDSFVNPLSGVLQVQASIPNNTGQLRSGMYARIMIVLPTEEKQIVLPETAVSFALYGESIFIIEEAKDKTGQLYKKVKQVVVKVSSRMGNKVKISSGIKSGDQIVTSGQVKLSNGSRVKIVKSDTLNTPAQLPKL